MCKYPRLLTSLIVIAALAVSCSSPIDTMDYKDLSSDAVVLNCRVNAWKSNEQVEIGFVYSLSPEPTFENGQTISFCSALDNDGLYSLKVSGLTPSTTYYYKAYFCKRANHYHFGETKSFTTNDFSIYAVDMGLSVKWANANVGATSEASPGDYYAWGETLIKKYYDWDSYKWRTSGNLTKYNTKDYEGSIDNRRQLELADDVASKKLGNGWHIPTASQWDELRNNSHARWIKEDGKEGLLVISNITGNSIFFPVTGCRDDSNKVLRKELEKSGLNTSKMIDGWIGVYWSSSLDTSLPLSAKQVQFTRHLGLAMGREFRFIGASVRAVRD